MYSVSCVEPDSLNKASLHGTVRLGYNHHDDTEPKIIYRLEGSMRSANDMCKAEAGYQELSI